MSSNKIGIREYFKFLIESLPDISVWKITMYVIGYNIVLSLWLGIVTAVMYYFGVTQGIVVLVLLFGWGYSSVIKSDEYTSAGVLILFPAITALFWGIAVAVACYFGFVAGMAVLALIWCVVLGGLIHIGKKRQDKNI